MANRTSQHPTPFRGHVVDSSVKLRVQSGRQCSQYCCSVLEERQPEGGENDHP